MTVRLNCDCVILRCEVCLPLCLMCVGAFRTWVVIAMLSVQELLRGS